jgi:hypothetical protein
MKDIYKKPIFYYILVPVLIGLWPLWLFTAGLPGVKSNYEKDVVQYQDAEKLIKDILENLDPQRLDYAKAKRQKMSLIMLPP